MRRRKKGAIKKVVLEIVSKAHPKEVRFSEIKKLAGARLGPGAKISNKVVFDGLKALEKEGQVERRKNGWREIRFYSAARARKFLGDIAAETLPVNISWTGHSFTPYIELGYNREISGDSVTELEDLAKTRFCREVKKLLDPRPEKEKDLIVGFTARSLWLGYKFFAPSLRSSEAQFKNLNHLVEAKIGDELGKHYLTEYISQGIGNYFGDELSIAEYKMLLLAYALLELFGRSLSVVKVPAGEKTNLGWMSRRRKKFQAFLEKIDKIRFTYAVTVGFEDLDKEMIKLLRLQRFDRWIEELEKHPKWELVAVMETLNAAASLLERGSPPAESMTFPILGWNPMNLYALHPRGKDPEFYRGIARLVQEALEKKSSS